MDLTRSFWAGAIGWAGAITAGVAGLGAASGQAPTAVASDLPRLAGFAMMIAAFPAGISVWRHVLAGRSPFVGLGMLTGAAGALAVVMFVLSGWAAPLAARAGGLDPGRAGTWQEPAAMTTPELVSAVGSAFERVREMDRPELDDWQMANSLDWHAQVRFSSPVLLLVLAWLGALTGFWTTRMKRRALEGVMRWGAGVFLLVTIYLFGENSYELIAIRLHGPAPFPGLMSLAVPGPLLVGMLIPTLILLRDQGGREEPEPGADM